MKPETPYYIVDEDNLVSSLKGFDTALSAYFPHRVCSYSVKTNSLPYCLETARLQGYYAEVVSDDEYNLALECGFKPNEIVYNGPLKSKETFLDAIKGGALVNIETFREIEWLKELPVDCHADIGLRMNINISQISPADQNHENDNSRFGFSCESGDFDKALDSIKSIPNINLTRLHIHRTSRSRSTAFYANLIHYALSQLQSRNMVIKELDLGGGYFGMMPGKPAYTDYAESIAAAVSNFYDLCRIRIIIEPGNAIVASCFTFVASVIDVKHHDNANYITIDGSRIDIDPFFRKSNYFMEIRCVNSERSRTNVPRQIIGGCTCLEYDRLFELLDHEQLAIGDNIYFHRVGAYTMTLTPQFIRYWPAVYKKTGNEELVLVRKKYSSETIKN